MNRIIYIQKRLQKVAAFKLFYPKQEMGIKYLGTLWFPISHNAKNVKFNISHFGMIGKGQLGPIQGPIQPNETRAFHFMTKWDLTYVR